MWQSIRPWKITAFSFTLMEATLKLPTFSHSSGNSSFRNCLSTQSWDGWAPGHLSPKVLVSSTAVKSFYKAWRRMGGGRSRRLKQVWALQTEEAVQSSAAIEWNEILLLVSVHAWLSYSNWLVANYTFGNTLKMFWLEQFRTEFF